MVTDEEFLAERRKVDQAEYLVSILSPENAPRMAAAANAIRDLLLADPARGWVAWNSVVVAGLKAAPTLAVKTVDGLVRTGIAVGFLERTGVYQRNGRGRKATDTRALRLVSWPGTPEELAKLDEVV